MKNRIVVYIVISVFLTVGLSSCGIFGGRRSKAHCPAFSQVEQPQIHKQRVVEL